MNKYLYAGLALLVIAAPATAAESGRHRICLRSQDIRDSKSANDEKSITFTMRDGTIWRNDLVGGRCPGLKFEGFSWVLRGNDDICESMQTLRVLTTGATCMLGKFTQLPKPAR